MNAGWTTGGGNGVFVVGSEQAGGNAFDVAGDAAVAEGLVAAGALDDDERVPPVVAAPRRLIANKSRSFLMSTP